MQEQQQASRNQAFENTVMKQQEVEDKGMDEDFTKRLQQLKKEGEMKKVASSSGTGGSSQTQGAGKAGPGQQQVPVAAFDAKPEDIYANPPSVADTLLGQLNSDVSDPALKSAQFGPNQIAVAGGAIIFGLVFVLVSGGDFAPDNRFKGVRPAQEAPDSVETGLLKGAIAQLEQDLAEDPNDTQATEQMALAYARLQQFEKASQILEKLVARIPNDADAWRVGSNSNAAASSLFHASSLKRTVLPVRHLSWSPFSAHRPCRTVPSTVLTVRYSCPSTSSLTSAASGRDQPAV
eukprot:1158509-Pelagomonas_calceolata.AAC.2